MLLALGLVSGCNTTATKTPNATESKEGDEYVTVAPEIGSRVKKRVKKSELAKESNERSGQRKKFDGDDVVFIQPTQTGPVDAAVTGNGP